MSAPGAHNLQSLTTLQVRVESSRETTYVFHLERLRTWPPWAVHVYLENRRTCLPRESSYVSTSRIVVRVYLENNLEGRPERGRKCYQKLLSHRKARVVIIKWQPCSAANTAWSRIWRATERPEIVTIKWQPCSAANTARTLASS